MKAVILKMKTEKKMRAKLHITELKARDRREACFLLLVFAGCILYVVSAMLVRGFV